MAAVQLYGQSLHSTEEQKTHNLLLALYEDATNCFKPSINDRACGLVILADLLGNRHLKSHSVLRAMAHILTAVNTPYDIEDDCAIKTQHINMATQVLKDLREQHGPECQGCALVRFRVDAGMQVDKWESGECVIMERLRKACESERKAIEDWNWEFAWAKTVSWADESVGGLGDEMPGLVWSSRG